VNGRKLFGGAIRLLSGMCSCNTKTELNCLSEYKIYLVRNGQNFIKPDTQRGSPISPLLLHVVTITPVQV
jgi:hypothetical protein